MKANSALALEAASAMYSIRHFMGTQQKNIVRDLLNGEEGEWFAAKMIELAALISTMPKTYEQDGTGDDATVYLHYFAGGSANWWIIEKDIETPDEPGQHQAFGLANHFGGPTDRDAELGYISIVELLANRAELDFHFQPRTLRELKYGRTQPPQPTAAEKAAAFIDTL